jgi:hypothetical protein
MCNFLVLVLICVLSGLASISCGDGKIYFKHASCSLSDDFVIPTKSCFAKSYSRNYSTVTVITKFKNPVHDLFVGENAFDDHGLDDYSYQFFFRWR